MDKKTIGAAAVMVFIIGGWVLKVLDFDKERNSNDPAVMRIAEQIGKSHSSLIIKEAKVLSGVFRIQYVAPDEICLGKEYAACINEIVASMRTKLCEASDALAGAMPAVNVYVKYDQSGYLFDRRFEPKNMDCKEHITK